MRKPVLPQRSGVAGGRRPPRAALLAALLAGAPLAACDAPFQPFAENPGGPFSVSGYLDLHADTQWIRVTPIRRNLLGEPGPLDARVTLQREGGGPVVTLRDSLFRFEDARLQGAAYGHDYWTTERLEPEARYRLTVTRSDGAATTALVEMPPALQFTFLNLEGHTDTASVSVRAQRVLFAETLHVLRTAAGEPAGAVARRQPTARPTGDPAVLAFTAYAAPAPPEGRVDVNRIELRIAAARSDWPYTASLPDLAVTLPSSTPSNVQNGLGFVGGVAVRTIPFTRCQVLRPRAGGASACEILFDSRSASVAGRVLRAQCGEPSPLAEIRLRETFADGAAVVLRWRTGWKGEYRFEGIEPGSDLALLPAPGLPAVPLPRPAPGQRIQAPDLRVPGGC